MPFLLLRVLPLALIISGWTALAQNIRIFPGKTGSVVSLPSDANQLMYAVLLICGLESTTDLPIEQLNTTTRWITPRGEIVDSTGGRFTFIEGEVLVNSTTRYPATVLWINRLSYRDAGVYTCQGRSADVVPNRRVRKSRDQIRWSSATVELLLGVELEPINSTVVTTTGANNTELSCEMSAYIRPDSSLVWEGPGGQRILDKTEKYQILFSNGTPNASVNGATSLAPSRVSTLIISDLEPSDAGNYTCRILNTDQASTIHLQVAGDSINTSGNDDNAVTTGTGLSTASTMINVTTTTLSAGTTRLLVAVTVGLVTVSMVILALVLGCLFLALLHRRRAKMLDSNNPMHVYDYISDESNYQVVDIVKRVEDCATDGIDVLNRNEAYGVCTIIRDSYECQDKSGDALHKNITVERNEAYSESGSNNRTNEVYAEITS